MVPYTVETFTASDGYVWHYRRYAPAAAPRARLVCLHGMQSHAGWYERSCMHLRQAKFVVDFLNRRGSGSNRSGRGDTPSYQRLLDDVAEYLVQLDTQRVPVFLAAISWGGKLAVGLQRYRPGLTTGLVLLCPGFFPRVYPPLRERLAIAASRLWAPQRYYSIPLNDPALFTSNPHWLHFLKEDSNSLHRATARFLLESARLDRYLRSAPPFVTVPVLLMLAGQDQIIDNTATRRFVARFATVDKEIVEYPAAHHTLEFEPDPTPFLGDLVDWLARHSSAPGFRQERRLEA
jgi:alpha-beta hydrolase superfamily lysophospholipase